MSGCVVLEDKKKPEDVLSVEDSVSDMDLTEMANDSEVVVLPHQSPMKNTLKKSTHINSDSPRRKLCSSFLGQDRAGRSSPHRTHPQRPHPVSPGSKALDEVLQKSRVSQGQGSLSKEDVMVRRKLSLDRGNSTQVGGWEGGREGRGGRGGSVTNLRMS